MDCGKLTLFLLLQALKRGVASQDFAEKHSVPTFMFRHKYKLKKGSLCNRNNMFFIRIFHQRHENWLHLLYARVLFVRLSWSKVQDILETIFVTNSGIKPAFAKYGAKHTHGSSTRILSASMGELAGYKQLRRGFF